MRVDKDVSRTDSSHPFFKGHNNSNVETLRSILLTYSMYNFDLGYCQVSPSNFFPCCTASCPLAFFPAFLQQD